MKKYQLVVGFILLINKSYALEFHLDVYGVDEATQQKIVRSCGSDIKKFAEFTDELVKANLQGKDYNNPAIDGHGLETAILKKINTFGHFKFTKLSTVFYNDHAAYTTVDIVQASEAYRMPTPVQRVIKKDNAKSQGLSTLFAQWEKYTNRNLALFMSGKLDEKSRTCPFAHCLYDGFSKKELQEEAPLFKAGAIQYKKELLDIIAHSDNMSDRDHAVFLVSNTDKYAELVPVMMHYINDADENIRNNVMRVLSLIAFKHKLPNIDISGVLLALNYPCTLDRNKAAFFLLSLAEKDPSLHPLIIQKSGDNLLKLLQLKQRNNHDLAYGLLKTLSHKAFSDADYAAWKQWLDGEKTRLAKK